MIIIGVLVAAVAAFVASSAYYTVMAPVERRRLGDATPDRGEVEPWKALAELLRTAIVTAVFAWIASRAELQELPGGLGLALVAWVGFPVVLLAGSVVWERVAPITAAIHAGDWLIKLLLIAVVVGLLH